MSMQRVQQAAVALLVAAAALVLVVAALATTQAHAQTATPTGGGVGAWQVVPLRTADVDGYFNQPVVDSFSFEAPAHEVLGLTFNLTGGQANTFTIITADGRAIEGQASVQYNTVDWTSPLFTKTVNFSLPTASYSFTYPYLPVVNDYPDAFTFWVAYNVSTGQHYLMLMKSVNTNIFDTSGYSYQVARLQEIINPQRAAFCPLSDARSSYIKSFSTTTTEGSSPITWQVVLVNETVYKKNVGDTVNNSLDFAGILDKAKNAALGFFKVIAFFIDLAMFFILNPVVFITLFFVVAVGIVAVAMAEASRTGNIFQALIDIYWGLRLLVEAILWFISLIMWFFSACATILRSLWPL
jgi:hypothetical protein